MFPCNKFLQTANQNPYLAQPCKHPFTSTESELENEQENDVASEGPKYNVNKASDQAHFPWK